MVETSLRTLSNAIEVTNILDHDLSSIYTLINDTVKHTNRFVREVSYQLLQALL
jgi:hypothetical protein